MRGRLARFAAACSIAAACAATPDPDATAAPSVNQTAPTPDLEVSSPPEGAATFPTIASWDLAPQPPSSWQIAGNVGRQIVHHEVADDGDVIVTVVVDDVNGGAEGRFLLGVTDLAAAPEGGGFVAVCCEPAAGQIFMVQGDAARGLTGTTVDSLAAAVMTTSGVGAYVNVSADDGHPAVEASFTFADLLFISAAALTGVPDHPVVVVGVEAPGGAVSFFSSGTPGGTPETLTTELPAPYDEVCDIVRHDSEHVLVGLGTSDDGTCVTEAFATLSFTGDAEVTHMFDVGIEAFASDSTGRHVLTVDRNGQVTTIDMATGERTPLSITNMIDPQISWVGAMG